MKIYELIRLKNAEIQNIKASYNNKIEGILKKWFPEFKIDFDFDDVTFSRTDCWCRFTLYEGNIYRWGYVDDGGKEVIHKEQLFRLSKNNGFSKEEINSIKKRLIKLYEGSYENE